MASTKTTEYDAENSTAAWFVALERARDTNNKPLEERSRRELARLGVSVNFFDAADTSEAKDA